MEVSKIDITRQKASELYSEYKAHRHYSTPIDDEIRKVYRAIAKGSVVIKALESIAKAGLNEQGLPKLAIVRADLPEVWMRGNNDGSCRFVSAHERTQWVRTPRDHSGAFTLLPGSLPGVKTNWQRAMSPLIPIHLRPKHALSNYHILFEAEWLPIPPRDPYLLRRFEGDLWLVVAAWDLTEVERAAMATRITLS